MSPTRIRFSPCRLGSRLLLCVALAGTVSPPAHAFWGLLGKAAGKAASAGKAAGTAGKAVGAAGKGAAAGAGGAALAEGGSGAAARGGAHLADDAAHLGARSAPELSSVNAALPPEVAAYLNKPAQSLSAADTAQMMDGYHKLVGQAGRGGDFTAVERAASVGPGRTLESAAAPAMRNGTPAAAKVAESAGETSSVMPWQALRLLTHAARAGNREAQTELDRVCKDGKIRRAPRAAEAQTELDRACLLRSAQRIKAAAAAPPAKAPAR